jgi:hypothetical protein
MRALALFVVVAGCSRGASHAGPEAPLVAASSDEVVATVDGRPIYASAVAMQARARGVDRKTALADLVDAEALAGEAARRGLDQDLAVRDETKGAMVRRYLATGFEREVTADDVPDPLVRREYQKRLPYLNHGTYADTWHLLVAVPKGAPPAVKAQAKERAELLMKRAKGLSLAEFQKLGADEGLRSEEVVTARDGWVERPYSEAAFTQLKKPGDTTTSLVETSYGYHVLYLVKWIPPEHISISEAAPKIREGVFPEFQKRAFAKLVDEAMARHKVELHPEHLPK